MKRFIIALLPLMFLVAACAQSHNGDKEQAPEATQTTQDADKAPAFEVVTIDGKTISLEKSLEDGKPVVVYFMASWCSTCARNWPALSEVYPEFEGKVTFVAVSIDPTDTEEVIKKLAEERGFKFPATEGNPDLMLDFGVAGQATTVGVNRDGQIAFKKPGRALSTEDYRDLFAGLLN